MPQWWWIECMDIDYGKLRAMETYLQRIKIRNGILDTKKGTQKSPEGAASINYSLDKSLPQTPLSH